MEERQLIVVVESTAAMGPYWETILTDYLDKIIRSFGGNGSAGKKPLTSNVEFALVTFSTRGCYYGCFVQRTGWTSDPDMFCQWLSALPFAGGSFDDAAIAEGLSEALMMFPTSQNGNQNQQNVDLQKHCILVAASNPYPLQTPVYVPRLQNLDQGETIESDAGNRLLNAEAVAKAFPQCNVSLSVICPKQLPRVRAIYNVGKQNSRTADPLVDTKNSHFIILIAESFREARSALSRSGITTLPSNQSPVKVDLGPVAPVTGRVPTSMPQVNGSIANWQPISARNMAPATVKVEPIPVTSMVSGPSFPHMPSVPRAASQGVLSLRTSSLSSASQDIMTSNENTQDVKPIMLVSQPLHPVGRAQADVNILNNLSQGRQVLSGGTSMGLQSMSQTPVSVHMSNVISSGMASSVQAAQNIFSSGQSGINSIPSFGSLTGPVLVGGNSGIGSLTPATSNVSGSSNIGMSQLFGGNRQGPVSMGQPGLAMSQGNISGAQMVQGGVNMNQNVISGLGPSVVSSGTGTMIPTPRMSQQVPQGMQPRGVNNAAANMPLQQQTSGATQSTRSKYVKVWEGSLSGQGQGQLVFITRLEGYRRYSTSESLASNWPATMQIVRLISQDHMNNKQYVGKADFLVFRAMNPYGFLGQLQEKKLCAVIQLPSQTLLLSVSDKACRLIGLLFSGDMVVFKRQLSSQQHQQMQEKLFRKTLKSESSMEERQLVVAVESTAAMGLYWETILSDYLYKIIRSFGGNDSAGQKPLTTNVEFALVTFSTHGCFSGFLVQRTGWTSDPDMFCQWLSALPFVGGGFDDAAIAEGLSEALMMFPTPQNGNQSQQNVDLQKHCVLLAASNPYPLQTPVYVPRLQNLDQESDAGNRLHDAEVVAKAFPQCSVSLSVICPKQLPRVRAIYNAGKRNSHTADPPNDTKNSHFLILISESFREALSALSRSGITTLPSNQSPINVDSGPVAPVTVTVPASMPQVNGSIANLQPISAGNMAPATVKVEPIPVTSMVSGPTFPHMPSVPRAPSQGVPSLRTSSPSSASQDIMTSNENTQDVKPMMLVSQPLHPVGPAQADVNILNNLSQGRQVLSGGTSMGLQSMGQTPVGVHMSNVISSGMASSVQAAQNIFSSGQSGINSMTSSGSLTGPVQVGANSGIGSLTSATSNVSESSNIGMSQLFGGNLQGPVSMGQPGLAMSQGNVSGAQMVQGGVNMNQNVISGLGPSVVSSGTGTMIPTPRMSQQVPQGMQPRGVNNAAANMPLQQQTSGATQSTRSKYVKVWEGSLSGQRQGQPVFITRLEGYRSYLASESLASNWPATMQIVRLISDDHMNYMQYVGKADFLVFRAMNPYGFLGQLQEKKLCAVIQLPSQTLLLSVSDKACRLFGMLFPGVRNS